MITRANLWTRGINNDNTLSIEGTGEPNRRSNTRRKSASDQLPDGVDEELVLP